MTLTYKETQVYNQIIRRVVQISLTATENSGFIPMPKNFLLQEEGAIALGSGTNSPASIRTITTSQTLTGASTVDAITTGFSASGTAYFADGDDFAYTGITGIAFTGVTGVSSDHPSSSEVQQSLTTVNVNDTAEFPSSGIAYFAAGDDFTYTGITSTSFTGVSGVSNIHIANEVVLTNSGTLVPQSITGCGLYLELRKIATSLSLYCTSAPNSLTGISGGLLGSAHTVNAQAATFSITYDIPEV